MKFPGIALIAFLLFTVSCKQKLEFKTNFDLTNDRIWVGKDFWSVPLEDWKVENGKLYCVGGIQNSRVNLLTHVISEEMGDFKLSAKVMLEDKGSAPGSAGFLVGMKDDEDPDVRAACYFGGGIKAGVNLNGYVFLKDQKVDLPEGFDFDEFTITVTGSTTKLKLDVVDKNGIKTEELVVDGEGIQGLVAIANNLPMGETEKPGKSKFSFDDFEFSGSKVIEKQENAFGPILWTMYTLSNKTVKLMALLPPIGEDDNQEVSLQLKKEENWETVDSKTIEPNSRTAVFKLENWDDTKDTEYRIEYIETDKTGKKTPDYYAGTIRKDPVDKPLKFGGLTCQFHFGFPYTPLVENLKKLNPDILYFSGDQIYEGNGGYGIKREPEDISIVNYLGKYYMFGWAFRDLLRDIPAICTPDDHDVFHGNLWGESGVAKPGGAGSSDTRGFMQSVKMVNVVNRTQCGQLPDPVDPTPIEQGMSVWYTGLNYGRISFAIVSDRIFKTGPEAVSDWEGRHDHMVEPREDLSFLDKTGVKLLGDRQMKFLNNWITDWKDVDMKVLLSQTVFANAATHHGGLEGYLYGDLDSGGWPKSGRDKVIKLMRKGAVFHINGDQHLPTLVQYGLEDYRDAGWSFCTPAIAVMYLRWFLPDEVGYPVLDRPEHGYPNTGKYTDAFGNKNYVYAVGNPGKITIDSESRYNHAQIRSSGFGFVTFDKNERSIKIDAWRFKADVDNPNPVRDEFPGWPMELSQFDNFGMGAENVLPEIVVNKPNQLIEVRKSSSNDLIRIYRMKGNSVQVKLFHPGTFDIKIGEGDNIKEFKNLKTEAKNNSQKIAVEF
ncbi:twin-arginine translocation pathway signal [Maribellus comscasis]|uniref:Twin-arginine translocation pathway signal n=1 Tax=Maribellus comscasis TaxID=2681766 RepID=A0A6I6K0Y4_9BACT|nr:alkaline phosphatase D family protein [Maribellus comscasis]QGY47110.1 twin-arginine translocation pathway signal [Maribellus comscasis]